MKNFLPDYPHDDRLQVLQDTADQIEQTTYYRDLSDQEIDIKRESFVSNSIEISKHDAVLAHAKAIHKMETKPLSEDNSTLLKEIHLRKAEVTGRLFHIADHDNSIMNTYDEDGEFISSRRLRPDEKQAKLFSHPAISAEK